ncbi:DNA repair rhp55 [Fusarium agapanthi]|uniref:DNA repair rhp55 n=1 Tax=Fusarium agapanthi TaxID=1803897 RepID=A0A9P5E6S3_9HYPO|nr:DNA repair rhp55 [Fusarium agapanthi]
MDYHSIHGYDRASFDTPSTHRLPTVSASQALDELDNGASTHVSTGIEELDRSLIANITADSQDTTKGGVQRGQVTEIWGPPGAGKTALGLQLTANALCDGDAVVWVVTNATKTRRNSQANAALDASESPSGDSSRFYHYSCFTLPHLVALVSRPTAKLIPHNCSLMVISSLSALVNSALPKSHDGKATSKSNKGMSKSICKANTSIAFDLVVLSQCATKMHSERGATLTAAVNASVWEQGISTRLVMFRDWAWQENNLTSVFLAGLQKLDGKACQEVVENVVAFKVELDGVSQVPYEALQNFELARHKRKLGQTELEVPDSEDDEDYGWADEDEAAMPAPPPQWQGSEDLILGQDIGQSEDENSEQEEPVTDDESIMK